MANASLVPEDVTAALRRLDADFMANAKTGDAKILVESFYSEDARVLPPHRDLVRGRRAIQRMWGGVIAAGLKEVSLATDEFDVEGDMAYGIGRYRTGVEPPGGPRTEDEGKYLAVYRKQSDGQWRAVADMFSPNK